MHLRRAIGVVTLGTVLACAAAALPASAQVVDRPAEIRGGTCANLGEIVTTLAHLVFSDGQAQGQTGAQPVEQSGTVVPFQLSNFLSADHAIVVRLSQEDATIVACGVIGGALNPDGTLAVGMIGMNGSGLSGVAYFTPIPEFSNLLVTILLVSNDPGAAPAPVQEVDASAPVQEVEAAASDASGGGEAAPDVADIIVSANEGVAGDGTTTEATE